MPTAAEKARLRKEAGDVVRIVKDRFPKPFIVEYQLQVDYPTESKAYYRVEKGRLSAMVTVVLGTKNNVYSHHGIELSTCRVRHNRKFTNNDYDSITGPIDSFRKSIDDVVKFFSIDECIAKPRRFIKGYSIVDGQIIPDYRIDGCSTVDTVGLIGRRIVDASECGADPWFRIRRDEGDGAGESYVLLKKSKSGDVYILAEDDETYDALKEGEGDERLTTIDAQTLRAAVNRFIKRQNNGQNQRTALN